MRRTAIERELRELVRRVEPGARVYFPRRARWGAGLSWNGRHLRPTGLTLESQCHEIAHVLVAPPERRALPELGLGPDPYRRNFAARVVPIEVADAEEADACTMQLLLVRVLGLDEVAVMIEMHTPPLTREQVVSLRERCPDALPAAWWERALAAVP